MAKYTADNKRKYHMKEEFINLPVDQLNRQDPLINGNNALILTASINDLEMLNSLIEKGADLNLQNNDGNTALMIASKLKNYEVVKALLNNNADISLVNNNRHSALTITKSKKIKKFILNKMDSLLIQACADSENLNYKFIESIIAQGANVNAKDTDDYTALIFASSFGKQEIVELLLSQGANINAQDKDHYTPLMLASMWGHLDTAKLLLDNGADSQITNTEGYNAHDLASYYHDESSPIAKLLQKKPVNNFAEKDIAPKTIDYKEKYYNLINRFNELFGSPTNLSRSTSSSLSDSLNYQEKFNQLLDQISKLQEKFSNKNKLNTSDKTLIGKANPDREKELKSRISQEYQNSIKESQEFDKSWKKSTLEHEEKIKYLETATILTKEEIATRRKASINETAQRMHYRLEQAFQNKDFTALEKLLKEGADINSVDRNGNSLLHKFKTSRDAVEKLLYYGADINQKDGDGKTLLHHFVNDPKKVKFLLKNGASNNIKNNRGDTPLSIAMDKVNAKVIISLTKSDHSTSTSSLVLEDVKKTRPLSPDSTANNRLSPIIGEKKHIKL
jgi:ankyrin repeat protein